MGRSARPVDLQEACDRNHIGAFRALAAQKSPDATGTRTFGSATAVATGAASPFWNPVFVLSPAANEDDVIAAVEWVRSRRVAASLQVRGDLAEGIAPIARSLGLTPDPWPSPGMILSPIPEAPPSRAPGRDNRVAAARLATTTDAGKASLTQNIGSRAAAPMSGRTPIRIAISNVAPNAPQPRAVA